MSKFIAVLLYTIILLQQGNFVFAGWFSDGDLISIIEKTVVRIRVCSEVTLSPDNYEFIYKFNYGTGIVIHTEGYILTADHVLQSKNCNSSQSIWVQNPKSNEWISPQIIKRNEKLDLALLQVGEQFEDIIEFSETRLLTGDKAWVAGFPDNPQLQDKNIVLSLGNINNPSFNFKEKENNPDNRKLIQISNYVIPGFSGGPLLDEEGKLLGVILYIIEKKGIWHGESFAIDVQKIKDWLKQE
jgi:S1-C subfamily serine protease